ncbi:hypothetical protein C2845_PM09G04880 [Panicum miliaceum]|uniref:KIB1-4 beta-propeller domain-containing protein n=1 Tax=Panicum miliaceum TaxID=4540 RepID=A0A3L6S212_PANMI|nr:hypothetical protein C2845_PM09G04880 [Panicum miliaceum]
MAAGGWSSLPADLVKEISGRLSSDADLLHIHQICPHWRASTSLPAAYRPWVVAGRALRSGLIPIGDYSLRLPRRGAQRMEVGAPPAGFPYCCGTSRGWLALADEDRSPTRLVLWEPLSNTEIALPCPSPLTRIFLSDDPLISSNWIAVATQLKGLIGQTTLLWRPGDADWTMMYEEGTFEIDTIAFLEGKAYYIDIQRNIVICDLNTGTDSSADPSPKCTRIFNVCSVVRRLCRCDRLHLVRGAHLVACNGELLLVVLRLGSHPSLVEVYKPEWTLDLHVELRDRVTDLGDYSLFVGGGDTFALSAKEFPSIKRNCIYYIDEPCNQKYWISVFHLGSNDMEEIPYPEELKQDKTNWTPYAWFCLRKPLRSNDFEASLRE